MGYAETRDATPQISQYRLRKLTLPGSVPSSGGAKQVISSIVSPLLANRIVGGSHPSFVDDLLSLRLSLAVLRVCHQPMQLQAVSALDHT